MWKATASRKSTTSTRCPASLEPTAKLLGRAVVAGTHGCGDDEDAPAHEGRDYRPQRMLAVLLALGAALAYAAASVLQQREAEADDGVRDGGGVRLVLRLARKPVWLAGLGADGIGYCFQAAALGVGELLVVQPVLTSGILFALPAGAWWSGRRLRRADFGWACALAVGLTVFLLLAGTDGGKDRASTAAWLTCAAIAVPALGLCLVVATRSFGSRARGALRVHHRRDLRSHRGTHQVDRRVDRRTMGSARSRTGSRTRWSCSAGSAS